MKYRHTELEDMLLDELKHVLFVIKNRMISPRNYTQFMGELRMAISKAEQIMEGEEECQKRPGSLGASNFKTKWRTNGDR